MNMPAPRRPVVILCGPTASGKTALAIRLAKAMGGTLINADSMQVYNSIPILAASPTAEEMAEAPHRLFGYLDPANPGSLGNWLEAVRIAIYETWQEGRMPIVVGGTGMYIKGLLEGVSPIPDVPECIRQPLRQRLDDEGIILLYAELQAKDPAMAETLEPGDSQRILRALEVLEATGKSLLYWQSQTPEPPIPDADFHVYALTLPRDLLYDRCNARLEQMIEQGALDELQALLVRGLSSELPAMRAVGVPELTRYLQGKWTREEALTKAQQATRNYAKRQLTWLRNQLPHATPIAFPYDKWPESLEQLIAKNPPKHG
ncbi:MAG: tRNA (adenosine(37)-N6)-dimethylallyltransferase MiaA [Rickettsiales bacterium]